MIGYFLIMLGAIIASGTGVYFLAKKKCTVDDREVIWWTKKSLAKVFTKGAISTIVFLVVVGTILHIKAAYTFENGHSLSYVLDKMQYDVPDGKNSQDEIKEVKQWFAMKDEPKYDTFKEGNKNLKELRERFINSYVADVGNSNLLKENPLGLLDSMVTEQELNEKNQPKACHGASDTFLVMWLKTMKWQGVGDKKVEKDELEKFNARLFKAGECIDVLSGSVYENSNKTIQYEALIPKIHDYVKAQFVPGIGEFVMAMFSANFPKKSSKAIISGLPTTSSIEDGVYAKGIGQEERLLLMAQLDIIKDNQKEVYRIAVMVFGPIQFILLTIFFTACLVLGERRKLTMNDGHGLQILLESRLQMVIGSEASNTHENRHTVKELLRSELDEEASFPITFMIYVLPLIGFMGTIIGLAGSLESAVGVLKASVLGIAEQVEAFDWFMSPLGVAFDTTLIALATTPFIYFLYAYIRSYERGVLKGEN